MNSSSFYARTQARRQRKIKARRARGRKRTDGPRRAPSISSYRINTGKPRRRLKTRLKEAKAEIKLAYPEFCRFSETPHDAPCANRGFCPRDPTCTN
jgi:hypothetical protein